VVENLPASFVDLLIKVSGPDWLTNPGKCWVSYKCFEANGAATYIDSWLKQYAPNLEVFYNTVVKSTTIDSSSNRINSITAIRRMAVPGTTGYERSLSHDLVDWYSTDDSSYFTKEILTFDSFSVVVEATEFGDILLTAEASSDGSIGVS
jgi:hypothetical protein